MAQIDSILSLLDTSHSPFHAVKNLSDTLKENGFVELDEKKGLDIKKPGKYFLTRNQSSLIAFVVPWTLNEGFRIVASHSDSPTFKLKPNPLMNDGGYSKLDVEPYGGSIYRSWMDRPLSIAGRIMVQKGERIESRLLDIDEDLCIIPSLCIHFDREVNQGKPLVPGVDLVPLLSTEIKSFLPFLQEKAGLGQEEEILSHDLYLYAREKARVFGAKHELLSSPKLDNLESAYATLSGFLKGESNYISVYCCFDNEEVGSLTRQGASGTFLADTLSAICLGLGKDYGKMVSNGFFLSVDNGHALHPNHPEASAPTSRPLLNKGILIKSNASQRYTTDGLSSSVIKMLCQKADVPYQEFVNRSDIPGGSTLGNLSNAQVSFLSCDIGLPQLAMHSAVETGGVYDLEAMEKLIAAYFTLPFSFEGNDVIFED